MTVKNINDKIIHDITLAKRRAKREMTKKGFVNIDGSINQYNPVTTSFLPVFDSDVVNHFNWITGTTWNTISDVGIVEYLQEQLPKLTTNDVRDFTSYIQQNKVVINEEAIQDLMTKAIKDNEVYTNPKADFKGKLNIQSELIILRNNNIYCDGNFRLFQLKDNEFTTYSNKDVLQLFRQTIGTEDTRLVMQYVKNHWRTYSDSLTNVSELLKLLNEKKLKEETLNTCKKGYDEVMSIISNYGGK